MLAKEFCEKISQPAAVKSLRVTQEIQSQYEIRKQKDGGILFFKFKDGSAARFNKNGTLTPVWL